MLLPQVGRVAVPSRMGPGPGGPPDEIQRDVDAIFLLHALRAAVRVAEMAEHLNPALIRPAIDDFKTRAPDAIKLRNVFEHFDEYEAGDGRVASVNRHLKDALTFFECDVEDEPDGDIVIRVGDLSVKVGAACGAACSMLATVRDALDATFEA